MKRLGIGCEVCAGVALAVVLGGCNFSGQARREGASQAQSAVQPSQAVPAPAAPDLKLRIVGAASAEPNRPDPGADLSARSPEERRVISADGREIDFSEAVVLADQDAAAQTFLVWSAAWDGRTIQAATVEQTIEDENGKPLGEPARYIARPDGEAGRWFVPLGDLAIRPITDEHPGLQHRLLLDLVLSDGTRTSILVRMRFQAPLPPIGVNGGVTYIQHTPVVQDPTQAAQALKPGQPLVVMARTTLGNPVNRPVLAWIRLAEGDGLWLTALLHHHWYQWHPEDKGLRVRAPYEAFDWRVSSARIRIAPRMVGADWGTSARLQDRGNGWFTVALKPRERGAQIEWLATVDSGVSSKCEVPAEAKDQFTWTEPYTSAYGPSPQPQTEVHANTWRIVSYTIRGSVSIQSDLSETWEAMSDARAPRIWPLGFFNAITDGDPNLMNNAFAANSRFSCQGWFD
jgi:hypothetical protein